jgi:carboxyl-terminal processing protease
MTKKGKIVRRFNRLLVLFLLVAALCPALPEGGTRARVAWGSPAASASAVVEEVKEYLRRHYVDPLPPEKLEKASIEEILAQLQDPYTEYLSPKEYKEFLDSLRGDFSGVGLRLEKLGDYIVVVAPIAGSPAERAGIRPGDRILAADGQSLVGTPVEKAVALIRGEPGSSVVLTIWRENQGVINIRLVRERLHVPSAYWKLFPEGIGYLRLDDFGTSAGEEVRQALEVLGPRSKGLILDLRGNPGGLLDSAVEVAGYFVPSGPVAQVIERDQKPELLNTTGRTRLNLPVVVLVDRFTASAAEIVAGAIQDYRTGLLVGERTFGKGSVQSVFELENGGALKLSVARYRTALGREVDKKGIEPDFWVVGRQEQEEYAKALLLGRLRRGRTVKLSPGEAALGYWLRGNRAYVSSEFFTRVFGAYVDYPAEQGKVLVRYGPHEVLLEVGEAGQVAAVPRDGVLWLPLRLVVENLGGEVYWNKANSTITVSF